MRKLTKSLLLVSLLLLGGLCRNASAAEMKKEEAKSPWKIAGQLEEACSCNGACPCWFGNKPTRMTCGGGEVVFIEKGNYGGTSLDGLAVGAMVESPSGQSMLDSIGNWNFAYLYIDDKANPEQRKALDAVGRTVFPISASTKTETRYAPITRKVDGKEHKIVLGSYGTFSGHLVEGGLGGSSKIVNPPGADPLHKEYEQGETSKLTYTDAGQNWDFTKSNYMFANFVVDSEQFAKYEAELSQKMEAMKKQKAGGGE
jgi:hypothetical protein